METSVPGELIIAADWERLDQGSPEERACFAAIGLRYDDQWLSEGYDSFVNRIRTAPMLSAYHLAQWTAWNWWRLRWEPRSGTEDWPLAHRLSTIGEGYVWPNITIFSDGERVAVIAKPTFERPSTRFRYINDFAAVMPARAFENAVDQFIEQVRGQLRAEGLAETNLDLIWSDVCEERRDGDAVRRRKLEALLGCDPDQANEAAIERLIADAAELGMPAMNEVAADHARGGDLLTADALRDIANGRGFDASPRDMVHLRVGVSLPRAGDVAAWRLGKIN